MEPFTTLASQAVVLPDADIDTDIIFPARFLMITAKKGLGRYAFNDKRYVDGVPRPDFPLNEDKASGASILVAGDNFGCGSSREQAVWALHDLGLRAIVSTSFGEIFRFNCFKNGVLPIILDEVSVARLRAAADAGETLTVDLTENTISAPGQSFTFEVEDWRREALLNGWDEVLTLLNTQSDAIAAFETRRRATSPWLFAAD